MVYTFYTVYQQMMYIIPSFCSKKGRKNCFIYLSGGINTEYEATFGNRVET